MLEILLMILKVLGVTVLVVLLLIAVVLLLVLFAPIKYSSEGYKKEGLRISALVTYLNPMIRVLVEYPSERIAVVKILGFTVYRYDGNARKGVDSEEKDGVTGNEDGTERKAGEEPGTKRKKKQKRSEAVADYRSTPESGTQAAASDYGRTATDQGKSQGVAQETIAEEVPEDTAKKDGTFDRIRSYITLCKENKDLVVSVLTTVFKALGTILPKKLRVDATLGTGQADVTGYLYAAYCGVQGLLPKCIELHMEPVWIEKKVEGEYFIKGRIRLIHLLVAVIKIVANKDVRVFYRKIRSV